MISGTTHPLQQEVITLRWKIQEIENKLEISRKAMEILKKRIEKFDPEIWMTVKEIVQELHDQEAQQDLGMTAS
jgi:peptidoglycan hydrolase CwlO-like protein